MRDHKRLVVGNKIAHWLIHNQQVKGEQFT